MKIQVRQGVFETNSSSTHSLSMFSKSDWERFKDGELVIKGYPYEGELVDISTVQPNEIFDIKKFDADDDYYSYEYLTYDVLMNMDTRYCHENYVKELNDVVGLSVYVGEY